MSVRDKLEVGVLALWLLIVGGATGYLIFTGNLPEFSFVEAAAVLNEFGQ